MMFKDEYIERKMIEEESLFDKEEEIGGEKKPGWDTPRISLIHSLACEIETCEEWDPFVAMRRVLLNSPLGDETIDQLLEDYKLFRDPKRDVFIPVRDIGESGDFLRDKFEPYKELIEGLDPVGRDFLASVFCKANLTNKRLSDATLKKIIIGDFPKNSLIRIEALADFMYSMGVDMNHRVPTNTRDPWIIFSNTNKGIISFPERGYPCDWIIDTANFSRLVRRYSVTIENGEPDFQSFGNTFHAKEFGLSYYFRVLGSSVRIMTEFASIQIALTREFRLDEQNRSRHQPDLRTISEELNIGYTILLLILRLGGRRENTPIEDISEQCLNSIKAEIKNAKSKAK